MTATGTRPKGPNKPDSRMTQDCTYNNDIMAVNKPHAANEAVEIAQTLNCTLTNSVDYFDNRDVGPLFLSYNTLKSHFAYFRGRNADGSQISKMLRADYTEDEGYVTMDDMANNVGINNKAAREKQRIEIEKRRKKAQKKKERLAAMDAAGERQKNSWQNFSTKMKKKKKVGVVRKKFKKNLKEQIQIIPLKFQI